MNCTNIISQNINAGCLKNETVEREAVIINRKDVVVSRTASGLLQISIASGKTGYKVTQPSKSPYTGTNKSVVVGTYGNTVDKAVSFIVPLDTMELSAMKGIQSGAMQGLLNGEFVVVVRLKDDLTSGADENNVPVHRYEVIGLENGATISEGSQEFYNDDTRGNWLITLTERGATEPSIYVNMETSGEPTVSALNTALDTWFDSLTA